MVLSNQSKAHQNKAHKNTAFKPSSLLAAKILLSSVGFSSANAMAISLDEAIALLLETPTGNVPCARLLATNANPSGNLLSICERAVPENASSNASGGGAAATANNNPSSDIEFFENAEKKDLGNWSIFLSAESSSLDREQTTSQDGFESDASRFVVGSTYVINSSTAISAALNINSHDGDFNNGGDFKHESTGLRLFGSYRPTDKINIQLAVAYDDISTERQRLTSFSDVFNGASVFSRSGTALADYDYDQLGATARASYEFNKGRLTLSPQFGLDWRNTDYGTYDESGVTGMEVTIHDDELSSFQSTLGVQGSYAFTTSFGAFIPQFNLTWRHEFENESRDLAFSFIEDQASVKFAYQTDELDANFFDASLGGVFVFANGIQAFAHVQTLLSHDVFDTTIVNAGLRYEL